MARHQHRTWRHWSLLLWPGLRKEFSCQARAREFQPGVAPTCLFPSFLPCDPNPGFLPPQFCAGPTSTLGPFLLNTATLAAYSHLLDWLHVFCPVLLFTRDQNPWMKSTSLLPSPVAQANYSGKMLTSEDFPGDPSSKGQGTGTQKSTNSILPF